MQSRFFILDDFLTDEDIPTATDRIAAALRTNVPAASVLIIDIAQKTKYIRLGWRISDLKPAELSSLKHAIEAAVVDALCQHFDWAQEPVRVYLHDEADFEDILAQLGHPWTLGK